MNGPVFVKIDRYKKVQAVIDRVKKRVDDAKVVLNRLNELKSEEEKELAAWQAEIAKVESKVSFVEDALSKHDSRE